MKYEPTAVMMFVSTMTSVAHHLALQQSLVLMVPEGDPAKVKRERTICGMFLMA